MRKMCEWLKRKDVGSIGIGAMIVFIAMVLVAGIAASVLIQTSTKLETQAMTTGHQTIQEVAGGLAVYDIAGKVVTSDICQLAVTVRVRAGSPDIDLNHTTVLLSDGNTKSLLLYHGWEGTEGTWFYNSSVRDNGRIFSTHCRTTAGPGGNWTDLTFEEFGIIVLEDADSSCTRTAPVINTGDKVILTICCSATGALGREIPERTDVFGTVVPEVGSPGIISFTTPMAYSDAIYNLQ